MSEKVDLSLCLPGDECHWRNGVVRKLNFTDCPGEYPYATDGPETYRVDGSWDLDPKGGPSPKDIVRVTRNGVQVTPAIGGSERERQPGAYTQVGDFTLKGKCVGWKGLTADGREATLVEFVSWPKEGEIVEEAARFRDERGEQWAVCLDGQHIPGKSSRADIVGPYIATHSKALEDNILETTMPGLQLNRVSFAVKRLRETTDDLLINPRDYIIAALDGLANEVAAIKEELDSQ